MLIHIFKKTNSCWWVEKRQDILMGVGVCMRGCVHVRVWVRRGDSKRKSGFDMNTWVEMKG